MFDEAKDWDRAFGGCVPQTTPHTGRPMERKPGQGYRYEAVTVEGFVQQLAVSYLTNGYFFYVMGSIPGGKDPRVTDKRIIEKYGIDASKFTRYRRKAVGRANLQYLRYERTFLILATHGEHPFFESEAKNLRDVRRVPIKFRGYSVSYRAGHPSVRIERGVFKGLKSYFEGIAQGRTIDALMGEFAALPYEPYAPVRVQLFGLLRHVNKRRQSASLAPVPNSAIRVRRRIVSVFVEDEALETVASDLARDVDGMAPSGAGEDLRGKSFRA